MAEYWSQDEYYNTPYFQKYLSRTRFQQISSNINLQGTSKVLDKSDKLFNVWPLINLLTTQVKTVYKPEQHQSLDENSCSWT